MSVTEEGVQQASLMDMAVEIADQQMLDPFAKILRETVVHSTACAEGSTCNNFKQRVRIIRVLRIENWNFWRKYSNHIRTMKRDFAAHAIKVTALDVPPPLQELQQLHHLDEVLNECYLFHGTTLAKAVHIAQQGFDFRLSNPGYYGHGTYFASQACRSHQYTSNNDALRTMLLCRVAVGNPCYAQKVERDLRRPGIHKNMQCYDSVVANPGPMPGHHQGQRTHQEIVLFNQFQAYPEFIIQYVR